MPIRALNGTEDGGDEPESESGGIPISHPEAPDLPGEVEPPRAWQQGGAPTWRSGSYDPQLDLVYWGVGNAEPYDPKPREGLDSLYSSSVLAIRPKTGEIFCHFVAWAARPCEL